MASTAIDFLLEHMKQLIICKEIYNQLSDVEKLEIVSVYEDLSSLRPFLIDSSKMSLCNKHDDQKLKDLVIRITDMANQAEDIIDDSIVNYIIKKNGYISGMFINLQNEIDSLSKVVSEFNYWENWGSGNDINKFLYYVDIVLWCLGQIMNYKPFNRLQIESIYYKRLSSWKGFPELKNVLFDIITFMANDAEWILNSPLLDSKDSNFVYVSRMLRYLKIQIEYLTEELNVFIIQMEKYLDFMDFAFDYLNRLMNDDKKKEIYNQFTEFKKLQIESLQKDVSSLRISLHDDSKTWYSGNYKQRGFKDLVIRITDVAKEAKDIFDMSVESWIIEKKVRVAGTFSHVYKSGMLINVLNEIKSLKKEVSMIYEKKLYNGIIGDPHVVGMYSGESSSSITSSSSRAALPIVVEEEENVVVGFDNDVDRIRELLAGGSKQLDVISIVGMPGLGKTTLAKKMYNDEFVVYHFYIRGWTYVSQVYAKRDLLLNILTSVVGHRDGLYSMRDEKLGEELYKSLKGNIYLIVMDDMWDTKAWDDMKIYFPNDNNGSRIIITSRLTKVALHTKPERPPHLLHLLTEDESWDLLKQKVFGKESCTPDLAEIGEKIAHKCQGLPLAIVVVAGLLSRTDKKKEEWEKVAGSLSSHVGTDLEQCINDTLELSYYHLPHHLRLCFLYFGAFPEDYEIRVRKLIWLWIAEGFIHQTGHKTLEDVAEEFLTDLIDRSLVLVAKKRFSGGIRACRVHDLLRDLCLRKGKEENFMQQIYVHETLSPNLSHPSSCLNPIEEKQRRLCIFSNALEYISLKHCPLHIHSLLSFFPTEGSVCRRNVSCIYRALKLLRVLDLSAILLRDFPSEILQLVLLRYLELRVTFHFTLPESISDLFNLKMLRVSPPTDSCVGLPYGIWKMVNLRHLRIDAGCKDFFGNKGYPSVLHNLQTILYLLPSMSCQEILERTPNLRKLGFCGYFQWDLGSPNLHFLNHLETLKLLNRERILPSSKKWSLQAFKFPPNLRRLTLSNSNLDWEDMSTLGMLCNLEVLKLEYSACVGRRWETTSEGFERLKFLRLRHINIEQWEASSTDFPSLQQLVLQGCRELEGIPLDFGNIPTLQTIEVTRCSRSTENSARRIQEDQKDMANDWLKILINS